MARRSRSIRMLALFVMGFALLLSPVFAQSAAAHPLGNFTTNRYARIEVYQDALRLHYVVDIAEIPTFQAMADIDTDGDGTASQPELDAFVENQAARYSENFELTIDGDLSELRAAAHEAQLLPGQGGLDVLRLIVVYEAPVRGIGEGEVTVAFEDRNFANTQGWKEIVVRPSSGAGVTVPAEFLVEQSNALREYPSQSLRSAPDMRSAAFAWAAGSGSPAPAIEGLQLAESGRDDSGFSGIFGDIVEGNVSLGFLALSLLIAFAFGAQHAFGPGHGKTMVAAYLVGSRGTAKHAVALGATVTLTHTSTVYLLGFATLLAASWLSPEKVYLWMGVAAGVMVIAFGAGLLVSRSLNYRTARRVAGSHRHGLFGKTHSHAPHEHEHREAAEAAAPVSRVTWRSLVSLGVLGGLLPCPSAVVVMVAAISQGQVLLGMLLIVAFSLGLAGVLMALGISLVVGRRVTRRGRGFFERPLVQRGFAAMPVVSALVVTLVGVGLTVQAVGRV